MTVEAHRLIKVKFDCFVHCPSFLSSPLPFRTEPETTKEVDLTENSATGLWSSAFVIVVYAFLSF